MERERGWRDGEEEWEVEVRDGGEEPLVSRNLLSKIKTLNTRRHLTGRVPRSARRDRSPTVEGLLDRPHTSLR